MSWSTSQRIRLKARSPLTYCALGNDRVTSFKTNTYVNQILRSLGLKVYDPDLTEFVDYGQGSHCLTFEIERDKD